MDVKALELFGLNSDNQRVLFDLNDNGTPFTEIASYIRNVIMSQGSKE